VLLKEGAVYVCIDRSAVERVASGKKELALRGGDFITVDGSIYLSVYLVLLYYYMDGS
jgi:hypothetical protein